jgi:hypothetical protein
VYLNNYWEMLEEEWDDDDDDEEGGIDDLDDLKEVFAFGFMFLLGLVVGLLITNCKKSK